MTHKVGTSNIEKGTDAHLGVQLAHEGERPDGVRLLACEGQNCQNKKWRIVRAASSNIVRGGRNKGVKGEKVEVSEKW
jgi:hypothetical protein